MSDSIAKKNLHLIWAQDLTGGIGKNGKLPWNVSDDLKNFKKLTLDKTVVMGRKTWESLPIKPLPKRNNIVLSKSNIDGVVCFSSVNTCMEELRTILENKDVFVIGGRKIYHEFFKYASWLHITLLNKNYEADTFFPFSLQNIKKDFDKSIEKPLNKYCTYSVWMRRSVDEQ